jgi:hypothetical protein
VGARKFEGHIDSLAARYAKDYPIDIAGRDGHQFLGE